jgi:hypothetical protein
MSGFIEDLRLAIRSCWKQPGNSAAIVLSLALGVGLNAAVFSVINAFLFRPLAVPGAKQLVVLATRDHHMEYPHSLSYADAEDLADCPAFSGVISYRPVRAELNSTSDAQRVWVELVSGNYFNFLKARPAAVRLLTASDDVPGGNAAIVLSWRFWKRRFAGDAGIVGKPLRVNGQSFTVAGITEQRFPGTEPMFEMDAYVPAHTISLLLPDRARDLEQRDRHVFRAMARIE